MSVVVYGIRTYESDETYDSDVTWILLHGQVSDLISVFYLISLLQGQQRTSRNIPGLGNCVYSYTLTDQIIRHTGEARL